jgi:hypothetical protein
MFSIRGGEEHRDEHQVELLAPQKPEPSVHIDSVQSARRLTPLSVSAERRKLSKRAVGRLFERPDLKRSEGLS